MADVTQQQEAVVLDAHLLSCLRRDDLMHLLVSVASASAACQQAM